MSNYTPKHARVELPGSTVPLSPHEVSQRNVGLGRMKLSVHRRITRAVLNDMTAAHASYDVWVRATIEILLRDLRRYATDRGWAAAEHSITVYVWWQDHDEDTGTRHLSQVVQPKAGNELAWHWPSDHEWDVVDIVVDMSADTQPIHVQMMSRPGRHRRD